MTTLVLPPGAAPSPDPVHTPNGPIRYVAIRANLLPDEVVDSRRGATLKRRILLALAGLLVLLIALYGLSFWATRGAKHDLAKAQERTAALSAQQKKYDPVVTAQNESSAIRGALTRLMVGDLSWKGMLTALRSNAPSGVKLTTVSGTMTSGAAAADQPGSAAGNSAPGLSLLNQSGKKEVGTLTIAGSAPDKNAVAAYVDALNKVTGLTAALPQNVTATGHSLTFSISAIITTDALGGRYATPTASTGGN